MSKKQNELQQKIASVEETLRILYHQESNLIEAIRLHDSEDPNVRVWVKEIFTTAEYIVRLENSLQILKEAMPKGGKRGGKKKD